jgi:metallo-beta-lactamase class B
MRVLCLLLAAASAALSQPNPQLIPAKIIGNVYYVGENDLTSFLITTPKGNIVINTGFIYSVPEIRARIEKLGFKYTDTKILLVTHAHSDHAAGLALIRKQTGARMIAMEQEAPQLESGGKTDYLFGSAGYFDPVKVDQKIKDGDRIELGGTVITAHLTAGHTQGATSYTWDVNEAGKTYHVLLANLPSMNEGTRLFRNEIYPTIDKDYAASFRRLEGLPCDVYLTSHGGQFGLMTKLHAKPQYSPDRFVDHDYLPYILGRLEQKFFDQYTEEQEEYQAYKDHLKFKDGPR